MKSGIASMVKFWKRSAQLHDREGQREIVPPQIEDRQAAQGKGEGIAAEHKHEAGNNQPD
ncbi:hypothetical protein QTA57_14065 [Fontisubflavum oceani]|uniref:hypothetical protein n=1 Tax=Fontisubflavum oceani TaxID=2978973 RepID=UPI0025B3CC0D|nr:hypothetical protein [Fontisubflavum oceani]WJY20921.1 hypothetical protein QTA57_14065 [Fontisubflavum oceani]